jgi:hypothetical protein
VACLSVAAWKLSNSIPARPFPLEADLSSLRFDLLEVESRSLSLPDRVFALIQNQLHRYRVDSVTDTDSGNREVASPPQREVEISALVYERV